MNWIKAFLAKLANKTKLNWYDNQQKLILLVCLPSLITTTIALILAGISGYLVAFICLVLLMLCVYAVVASRQQSEYQIRTLSNLIESMIDGDYSLRGRLKTNKAFLELLNLINNLANTLDTHKIEAKESRLLLERIMEQMDAMVLATNEQGIVVMANASAYKLLLNKTILDSNVKLSEYETGAKIIAASTGIIDFNNTNDHLHGEHFLFKESFLSEGQQHQLYLITNAERLLMEKERTAWQSLLRVLSHEMNNSLTPIAAISQSMKKTLQKADASVNPQTMLEGVNIINERAESLSNFISSYSQLSHLPKPNKTQFDLRLQLSQLATLFPDGLVNISDSCNTQLTADKAQIEQVLINLFKNSIEAMKALAEKPIDISCSEENNWLHISIRDHGTGVSNLDNLFVPFYTTKKQGSGIGLSLCRQIMFNHNGTIKLNNVSTELDDNAKGVIAILSFPLSQTGSYPH